MSLNNCDGQGYIPDITERAEQSPEVSSTTRNHKQFLEFVESRSEVLLSKMCIMKVKNILSCSTTVLDELEALITDHMEKCPSLEDCLAALAKKTLMLDPPQVSEGETLVEASEKQAKEMLLQVKAHQLLDYDKILEEFVETMAGKKMEDAARTAV